jgi:hypothetical protein
MVHHVVLASNLLLSSSDIIYQIKQGVLLSPNLK